MTVLRDRKAASPEGKNAGGVQPSAFLRHFGISRFPALPELTPCQGGGQSGKIEQVRSQSYIYPIF